MAKVKTRKLQAKTPKAKIRARMPAPDADEIVFKIRREGEDVICERLPYRSFPFEDLAQIPALVTREIQKLLDKQRP